MLSCFLGASIYTPALSLREVQVYISQAAISPVMKLPPPKPYTKLAFRSHTWGEGVTKGRPDYVIYGDVKEFPMGENAAPLYPVEVRQKWTLPMGEGETLLGLYSDVATRVLVAGPLVQTYSYICANGFKYGVVTNGEVFWFLQCREDGVLMIAEVHTKTCVSLKLCCF